MIVYHGSTEIVEKPDVIHSDLSQLRPDCFYNTKGNR